MTTGNGKRPLGNDLLGSLKALLRAGLELGVSEAVRKVQEVTRGEPAKTGTEYWENLLKDADLQGLVEAIRADPSSILHVVKEVWSRGGPKEKRVAAEALGKALATLVPHRALGLARELAVMARNPREADWVGSEAIGRILDASPALADRIKQLVQENNPWIRRAAIAGIVFLVGRKRKYAAMGIEIILLLAEQHEKEIREGVRWAVREIGKLEPRQTAQALVTWVRASPTRERVQTAMGFVTARTDATLLGLQKLVFAGLAKFADGGGPVRKPAAPRSRVKRVGTKR